MADRATARREERRKSGTLRLRSISPTLTVDDLPASLAWYRDVVGFMVKEVWEYHGSVAGAYLVAGSESIVLTQDDWARGRDRKKGVGMRLHMSTAQDVDEIAASIRERGGVLASEPENTPWGTRAFSLVDPDGFKLTISADLEGTKN